MAISKDEIDKYIFDPENPKQCKSYNLLLKIAKKKNCVYLSKAFIEEEYKHLIINKEFLDSLWDIPKNFDNFSASEKIKYFETSLSGREYYLHINSLKINYKNFKYNKIFNCFFDMYGSSSTERYINKMNDNYDEESLFLKLIDELDGASFLPNNSFNGHKILFSNESSLICDSTFNKEDGSFFYDVSSIVITTNPFLLDSLIDQLDNSSARNVKPLFLKKIEDVEILLNVLENDLKKEKQKEIIQENILSLNEISVKDFFSINDISLNNLKDKKEIYIVGENGDGKSLLLQSIAVGLKGTQEDGLKEFRAIEDKYTIEIENSEDCKNNFLAYGSSRNNSCQLKEDTTGYLTLFSGEYDLKSPTKWLQYLDYSEQKENDNVITVLEAKKLLQELLNSDISIDISPDRVTFTEKGSEVSFEQLSAGYRGVITIICDMIARLSEKQQVEYIKDFQGIVLIDEVELHLHPKWKYNFMKKLRDTFPLIQFIVTTHSPTVILGASKEAVFYKIYKEDGEVKISNQIANEGYTHNSLVSSPLFDLDSITSRDYEKRRVSSDDYVYDKIHQVVSERIKEDVNTSEEDIMKLINDELDKL